MLQKTSTRLQTLNQHFLKANFATSNSKVYRVENTKDRSIILHPLKDHKYSIVWLHGLGDSAEGFVDIFLDPQYQLVPNYCKVILLTAPQRPVSMNDGFVMNSWYDIKHINRGETDSMDKLYDKYSQQELLESIEIVSKVLDSEAKTLNDDSKKVFIGGFSQGCALSIATFLKYDKLLGGLVGLSGMNALKLNYDDLPLLEEKKQTPLFLYHGKSDSMINHKVALMSYQEMIKQKFNIQFQDEEGLEHTLSMDEISKASKFLHKLMF